MSAPDVAVVGAGPNGLAAGVLLARAGLSVTIFEASAQPGGGLRSASLFDTEVTHDMCASVLPLTASTFFREFIRSSDDGPNLLAPQISYAHPLDSMPAGIAYGDLARTTERLGKDGVRWQRLMDPLVRHSTDITDLLLSDFRTLPKTRAIQQLANQTTRYIASNPRLFSTQQAPALLSGLEAHSVSRLPGLAATAVSLLLGHVAHTTGWPVVQGGSQRLADALVQDIAGNGGSLFLQSKITDIRQLSGVKAVLLDIGPREFVDIAGDVLPQKYRRSLERYRYGPGVSKVDYLVSGPIPWADTDMHGAVTVHLGGKRNAIHCSENLLHYGLRTSDPFVIVVDPMAVDPSRGLPHKRPLWAYCHVPNGSTADAQELITRQIERYAPGFSDTILAQRSMSAMDLADYNPNYVGGDIATGAISAWRMLTRPLPQWNPYRTPLRGVYLCSAATPPGPGIHGMSGYFAAQSVLRNEFGM